MDQGPDKWESWLDEHGRALILFARQWACCQADAEDIVQDAFVRFWRQRRRAHDEAAYLYSCVRTVALNRRREAARRHRREAEAGALAATETCFEDPLENRDRQELIETALRSLPIEQREVVVLKIWGNLTFQAVGEVLAISPDTAASRYRYALQGLRRTIPRESVQ